MNIRIEKVKALWRDARLRVNERPNDQGESNIWLKLLSGLLLSYLVIVCGLAFLWSDEPTLFDVKAQALAQADNDPARIVAGSYTTSALIHVSTRLIDKPGGYLSNDVSLPGLWMDNMTHWEYGALVQVRALTKAMRESFSRSQSQSRENTHLAHAEPQFNFSNNSWMLPQTENEYEKGIDYLRAYLRALQGGNEEGAHFYARADNLRDWLATVERRLGDLSQSLSASVGPRRVQTAMSPEAAVEPIRQTSWLEIDNNFYFARGSTWALIHFLRAVAVDFAAVLEDKNAQVSLQQIIRELEATQSTVYSPMILNGDGFGVLANHSLVMASYISRANAALIDLRALLSKG